VLALDQRGHGDSDPAPDDDYRVATMADDLAAFTGSLRLERFSLVGHSMGGRIAIKYAADHAARLDRLVIVDIGPDIEPAGLQRVRAMMAQSPERLDILSPAVAKKMAERLPDGRLVEITGAAHTVPADRPEEFVGQVRAFLSA
jgi:pimeloyl-ACP methyl ester carboxylesterase